MKDDERYDMNRTELALKYGGKYGSVGYYLLIHTLNYVNDKDLKALQKTYEKIIPDKEF